MPDFEIQLPPESPASPSSEPPIVFDQFEVPPDLDPPAQTAPPVPPSAQRYFPPKASQQIQSALTLKGKIDAFEKSDNKILTLLKFLVPLAFPQQAALVYAGSELYEIFKTDTKAERTWWENTFKSSLPVDSMSMVRIYVDLRSVSGLLESYAKEYNENPNITQVYAKINRVVPNMSPELLRTINKFQPIVVWNNCGGGLIVRVAFMRPGGAWVYQVLGLSKGSSDYVTYNNMRALTNNNYFYVYAEDDQPRVFGLPDDPDTKMFPISPQLDETRPYAVRRSIEYIAEDPHLTINMCL
jgi:hypothetical protein